MPAPGLTGCPGRSHGFGMRFGLQPGESLIGDSHALQETFQFPANSDSGSLSGHPGGGPCPAFPPTAARTRTGKLTRGEDQAPPLPDKTELNYPNLGSHLDGLVVQVEDGETTSQGAALDTPVHSGASVAVTIHLTGSVDEVVSFLEDNGGDPRNVGDDYIEAYVPVSLLGQLSEQPGVIRVREIVPPQPAQLTQRITGHGPPVHGSQAWNQAGYSGQGVKVGIIDTGFTGFSSLMETELPTTVVARCYTDVGVFTQDLADCEAVGPECHDTPDPLNVAMNMFSAGPSKR